MSNEYEQASARSRTAYEIEAAGLLWQAAEKFVAAGMTVRKERSETGIRVQGVMVDTQHKSRRYGYGPLVIGLRVGGYYWRNKHLFGPRKNGQFDWNGMAKLIRDTARLAAEQREARKEQERQTAASRKLIEEIIYEHRLTTSDNRHTQIPAVATDGRVAAHSNGFADALKIDTWLNKDADGSESRTYNLEVELSKLSREDVDAILKVLKWILVEHKLVTAPPRNDYNEGFEIDKVTP